MEEESGVARRRAVDRVANDRMAHRGAMCAGLMRTAGEKLQFQEGRAAASMQDAPVRVTFPPLRIDFHLPEPVFFNSQKWQVNASVVANGVPPHDGPIGFRDLTLGERVLRRDQRLLTKGDKQTSRRVPIKTVHQPGPVLTLRERWEKRLN